jgi:hypothetical protein
MVDATPDGEHMDAQTFAAALDLTVRLEDPLCLLSGGEPSEHPEIVEFANMAYAHGLKPILLTNGEFLAGPKRDAILDAVGRVQVTNDPRYYPRRVDLGAPHPKIVEERTLRMLSPFGRALTGEFEFNRLSPLCFNLRSATRTYGSIVLGRHYLMSIGRFCSPSVNIDGTISAGETPSCHKIGTVWDGLDDLTEAVIEMKCGACGLRDNLAPRYLAAIGEDR